MGFLLLLSWWHRGSNFEDRPDPLEVARQKQDTAIQERDDALRAWAEMGTNHERALKTNLQLQAEFDKAFKDLPWLEQRNFELAEENIVQFNEIERLKFSEQKYNELLQQVAVYGMTAKRPEYYQQLFESVQRKLEISEKHLARSENCVKALEEKLGTQHEEDEKEIGWLRAQLKRNSRSVAYWAKHRMNGGHMHPWGIRCACTEPEIAYGLKDQAPRIVELESTVVARDLTITHLRESRRNDRKNDVASTSTTPTTAFPSMQNSEPDVTTVFQTDAPIPVHACDHEQQCRDLRRQVADNARTITELRKECQDLRDAAPNNSSSDSAETDAKIKLQGELAAKEVEITNLREAKAITSQDLEASNETSDDLRKKNEALSTQLATSNEVIEDLRGDKCAAEEKLAAKDKEIDDLREEKTAADRVVPTEISSLNEELSKSRQELADAREVSGERKRDLTREQTRVSELETAQRGMEDAIKEKDGEINDLEQANQVFAEEASESAQNLQLLKTANANLVDSRREHAECKERLETQTAKVSELEDARRGLETTVKVKDDSIAKLEEQVSNATDIIDRQKQDRQNAIKKKDDNYQALYDLYEKMTRQKDAEIKEAKQSLEASQQSYTESQSKMDYWGNLYNEVHAKHASCADDIAGLNSQLRQGANTHTDLQTAYNTRAQELDVANGLVSELRNEVGNLQRRITSLERMESSSESSEAYRVEGANRARGAWQADADMKMSAKALELQSSEDEVFKLRQQLQKATAQASPLREMQLKAREDAVKAREDALDTDAMDQGSGTPNAAQEIKSLERKLAAANKDAGDARARNRGVQSQLNKERKERTDAEARHERELKKEKEEGERKSDILRLRLEQDNPLRSTVRGLQDQVTKLSDELGKLRSPEKGGE